jgi:hypothetical protein
MNSSFNSRFKNLVSGGGSKRRSSSNNSPTPSSATGSSTPTQRPNSLSPRDSNSSATSLPAAMNPQGNPNLGRPPSYTYSANAGLSPGQQQHGRPTSPLPPINTGAPYPPQQQQMGYPPAGGPPGYPPQAPPQAGYGQYGGPPPPAPPPAAPHAAQQYQRPNVAEVGGEGRSKAQLIVGIDFVSATFPAGLWRRR